LPSEIIAAFLWAQLELAEELTARRLAIWGRYHEALADLEDEGLLRRPIVPDHCIHNAHMYYVLLSGAVERQRVINDLAAAGIGAVFHYVPLHDAPAGKRFGRAASPLPNTTNLSNRLLRLPMWAGIGATSGRDHCRGSREHHSYPTSSNSSPFDNPVMRLLHLRTNEAEHV
jgi:dTDP-4-amino-4,6-dideoxygalactose transaminase